MADTGGKSSFASPEEEVEYWKEKAVEYRAGLASPLSVHYGRFKWVFFQLGGGEK